LGVFERLPLFRERKPRDLPDVTKVPLANRIERAGTRDLNKGEKIEYEVVADRRTGKSSADNLKSA
jgi:hypothetical protein